MAQWGCTAPGPGRARHPIPDIAWPPPPTPAKIRYAGQLESSADVKRSPGLFKAIGELIVGEREPQRMYGPRAVLCTRGGQRVWVADPGGRRVHLFDLQRRTYQAITQMGEALLLNPVDLCAGPGKSILLCDSENIGVYRLAESDGSFLGSIRLPEDIRRPVALHYDERREELFVVDAIAHDIKVLDREGRLLRILGQRGGGPGQFNYPCDIAEWGGNLWIVDAGNNRIQGITPRGQPVQRFGQEGDAPGDLALPKSIAFDSEGHAYVVDARFENVQVFDSSGHLLLFFGQEGTAEGEFWLPSGIFIDLDDRIWVCDTYNGRLQMFDYIRSSPQPASDN